ncbi:MlaD family protein, partial [Mycobacterium sp. 852002-40037_SCH5390672]|uniref:MlaD family protein n=1 Tax=Mycobacterium sp. 852002-40037_SCH5390672 TaxID=1834089 RepID=UPI0012E89B6C
MSSPAQTNSQRRPPYRWIGVAVLAILALLAGLIYGQFRGGFTPKTQLTMLASRAGLVMDPGSKVTYNGVEIGRVGSIAETVRDGKPAAKFTLEVYPRYLALIPSNVNADIKATTVFGGKYVSLTTPANPSPQKISPRTVIDAVSYTHL